ncbi:MAG: PEGA domain-containing protein [Brevinematales bacterium]|nr:PEGA domain-containing protein [Brevinematales bacterium]
MKDVKAVTNLIFLVAILFVLGLGYVSFANVLIVSESPIKGKVPLSAEDTDFVNTLTTYALNDLSDVLPFSYIDVRASQDWYNSIVDLINATNTNVVMVKGKPSVPKPLPKINITALNPTTISTLTRAISDIKGVIVSSYSVSGNVVKVVIQYLDQTGKVINRKNIDIPISTLRDRDTVLLQVKENIVDLLNAWKFYYYDPKRTATVNISVKPSPKDLNITVRPDNIQLKPGKNTISEGEYTLILSASGFQTIVTNVVVPAGGNINLSFSLVPSVKIDSPVPSGGVYIDANVKGVSLIIAEGNVVGTTPLYTNLTEGIKNVIFQQSPTTLLKTVQIEVKPNQLNYYFVNLERVGAGVNIIADNGAFVVINRRLEGVITTGSYSRSLGKGIHTITVFKNGFEAFRTNVNITSDEKVTLRVSLTPKKVPVFIVTPQSREVVVSYQGKNVGVVPYTLRLEQGRESRVDILAQEFGFNNSSFSVLPSMTRINTIVQNLSPLYGDLLILTDPIDAVVKVDGRVMGKTGLDGLLLRSISARRSFIFIQKEGYKAIKTNFYILPNIQNSLSYKLKEAPIKLFINTLPVQNVSIYMNDEYYGENDGVVNVELGNFVMKLLKRGYKTIYTNVSFPDKIDTVIPLTFQMVTGLSETEVLEQVNSNISIIDSLIANDNYLDAYNLIKVAKDQIVLSGYTNNSQELLKLYNFVLSKERQVLPKVEFILLSKEADETISKVDSFSKVGVFDESIKIITNFLKKVDASTLLDDSKSQIRSRVRDKYREIALNVLYSKVSNAIAQANRLVLRGEKSAAVGIYDDTVKSIDEFKVDFQEVESEANFLRDSILSNYIPLGIEVFSNKVEITIITVNDLENKKNYSNAIDILSSAIKDIKLSRLYYLDEMKRFEAKLNERFEELIGKIFEEEFDIKSMIREAIRLANLKEYDLAIRKYKEIIDFIDRSRFKDNPYVIKLKDQIITDIVTLEQEKGREEEEKAKRLKLQEEIEKKKKELPWWVRMTRAWTGVGLEFFGTLLIPNGMDFYTTNMNIPVGTKIHVSFLPILGLSFGGYYNVNSDQVSLRSAYLRYSGFGQMVLRIPIVKQFSLFGAFGVGLGQLVNEPLKFRLGRDYIMNAGVDLKFSWFGIRLSYDMAFYDDFTRNQLGGSFGIILWATED